MTFEDVERDGSNSIHVGAVDALLRRLIKVHGEHGRPDIAPELIKFGLNRVFAKLRGDHVA